MPDKVIPNKLFFEQVEESLRQGKRVRFKVNGVSMIPTIRNGSDSVTIEPISVKGTISLYDIVLFCYNGIHILHRVIAIDGDRITTRGDGAYYVEEHLSNKDVIGVVVAIHRESGRVIDPNRGGYRAMARFWHGMPGVLRRLFIKIISKV